jgi:hypothetical protein
MCAGCVMTAAVGATGARSWLQAHHATWLTPRRLKAATIAMFVAAFGFSSVGLSGSTAAAPHRAGMLRSAGPHAGAGTAPTAPAIP